MKSCKDCGHAKKLHKWRGSTNCSGKNTLSVNRKIGSKGSSYFRTCGCTKWVKPDKKEGLVINV